VPTSAIYIGVIPFITLQLIACVLVFAFPGLATALPKAIGW
jgi:TRAP-type mannitol/chloroaromatic compound transport system permease large subunit